MDAGEGDSDAVPFSRPHPRSKPQTVAENLHGNWNIERGHLLVGLVLLEHDQLQSFHFEVLTWRAPGDLSKLR